MPKTPRTQLYSSALCHQRSCWPRSRGRAHLGTFDRTRMAEHVRQPATPSRRRRASACSPAAPDRRQLLRAWWSRCRSRWASCTSCSARTISGDEDPTCPVVPRRPESGYLSTPWSARHASPFCAHRAQRAGVILLFRAACTVRPWTTCKAPAEPLRAGGIYHVDTGAGCVRDEPFDPLSSGETFGGRFDGGAAVPAGRRC